jgi:hypothetical protein
LGPALKYLCLHIQPCISGGMDEGSRTTAKKDSMEPSADVHELKTTRRGSKRPGYTGTSSTLAAATNDPIALIKTNIARNADARRWRDLMLHYQNRIGDVRMREESVRVRVLALVNATLELERLTDGLVAGRGGKLLEKRNYDSQGHPHTLVYERGDPHLLMHLTGIIQSLLKSLGLDKEPKPDRKAE